MTLKIGDLVGGGLRGALRGVTAGIGSQVVGQVTSALFMSGRSIGGIIPDVTIEENLLDTLVITDHPVEQGAPITDHSFRNSAEVTMRVAWSNSRSISNSIVSGSILSGTINNVSELYRQLLDLQKSREPFDLVTGKRTYKNMLIKSIANTTARDSENSLALVLVLRQVNLVQAKTVDLAPADAQSSPQDTAAPSDGGTKQPIKAQAQSALYTLVHG